LSVLDLGGVVTALQCPDRDGRIANVVMGPARLEDHLQRARNFSSLVGRYAGRIAGGRFVLDGRTVELAVNEASNTLHGGPQGFGARLWAVTPVPAAVGSAAIELTLVSEHGDQGFPGRLEVRVRYTLTRVAQAAESAWLAGSGGSVGSGGSARSSGPATSAAWSPSPRSVDWAEWRIDYHATTDRPTVVNLTHHAYWNLAGGGSIEDHRLTLPANRYAALGAAMIPQGFEDVAGTPLDFRGGQRIGAGLRSAHPQMRTGRGYDHFFQIDRAGPGLVPAARLEDPASGRVLEIETTEPGLQFYSGNFLDGTLEGRHGAMLRQGDGLCLETQHVGDSPNRAQGPSTVLRPGEVFSSTTVHRLGLAS
jgi:aldose 1-epimerase